MYDTVSTHMTGSHLIHTAAATEREGVEERDSSERLLCVDLREREWRERRSCAWTPSHLPYEVSPRITHS